MSDRSLDFHVTWHVSPAGNAYVKVAVYSTGAGRFGSELVVTYPVPTAVPPRDPEELASLLLGCVAGAVYHS